VFSISAQIQLAQSFIGYFSSLSKTPEIGQFDLVALFVYLLSLLVKLAGVSVNLLLLHSSRMAFKAPFTLAKKSRSDILERY